MIVLDATTTTLEVLLSAAVAAAQSPVVASYVDITATGVAPPASANAATNNTTAVTAVAAPAAATSRQIRYFSVYNADTGSITVTVRQNFNATTRILNKTTLAPGETLTFTQDQGWYTLGTDGAVKQGAPSSSPAVTGAAVNLAIANGVSPLVNLNVTADELVLKTTGGAAYVATSVSVTPSLTNAVGANGLDAGTEAASTWYYMWVIYNGTTVASLLSTSATTPTMPGGYTYKALVGAVYNDASSNLITIKQKGNKVWCALSNVFDNLSPAASNTLESRSLAAFVPATAKAVTGEMGGSNAGAANWNFMAVAGDSAGTGEQILQGSGLSTGTNMEGFNSLASPFISVPLVTAQTIYWKMATNTSKGRLSIGGWEY